jgi:hypothetical protein
MSTGKTAMSATVGEMLRLCAYKFVASAFRQAMSPPTQCEHIFPPHPRTLLDAAGMSQTGPSAEVEAWAMAMGGGWSPGAPKRNRNAERMPFGKKPMLEIVAIDGFPRKLQGFHTRLSRSTRFR